MIPENFLDELQDEEWHVEVDEEEPVVRSVRKKGSGATRKQSGYETTTTVLEERIEEEEEEIVKIQMKKIRRRILLVKKGKVSSSMKKAGDSQSKKISSKLSSIKDGFIGKINLDNLSQVAFDDNIVVNFETPNNDAGLSKIGSRRDSTNTIHQVKKID